MDRNALFVILGLAALAAVVVVVERKVRRRERVSVELEGFGGWLLLLAVMQWLNFLLWAIVTAAMAFDHQTWLGNQSRTLSLIHAPLAAMATAFTLYVNAAMMRRKKSFPPLFRIQLCINVLLPLLLTVIEVMMPTDPDVRLAWASEVRAAIVPAVASVLWYVYSLKSVRVRNTFIRE